MIKANKRFGQNFLKDNNVIDKIVNSINVSENDLVIEIGPGMGALTKKLKEKKSYLLAFEIDERMHDFLDYLEDKKTKIIYQDILETDLNNILSSYKYEKLYVVANLPYYITTPIIQNLISLDHKIDAMTIMVQNEVADRFSAEPCSREYGMMTVLLNYKYNVKKLFVVKNTCFNPIPKVDSAVVNLTRKENIELKDYNNFYKLVSTAFKHKRKTLKNNLGKELYLKVLPFLSDFYYDDNVRAEEITVEEYIYLSNNIKF